MTMGHSAAFTLLPLVIVALAVFFRGRRLAVCLLALVLIAHDHLENPSSHGSDFPPCCVLAHAVPIMPTHGLPAHQSLLRVETPRFSIPHPLNLVLHWDIRAPPKIPGQSPAA